MDSSFFLHLACITFFVLLDPKAIREDRDYVGYIVPRGTLMLWMVLLVLLGRTRVSQVGYLGS